jgi:hypothetical protein
MTIHDQHLGEPGGEWRKDQATLMHATMPDPGRIPSIAREWSDATQKRETVLAAARHFLAQTAETVTPDANPAELLAWLAQYRANLAALVDAVSLRAPLVRTVEESPPR